MSNYTIHIHNNGEFISEREPICTTYVETPQELIIGNEEWMTPDELSELNQELTRLLQIEMDKEFLSMFIPPFGTPEEFIRYPEVSQEILDSVNPAFEETTPVQGEYILSKAFNDIIDERVKQINRGFDAAHDLEDLYLHKSNVAALYLIQCETQVTSEMFEKFWPHNWDISWWRPEKTHRENLVKAAALIIAEIEALDNETEGTVVDPILEAPDFLDELREANIERATLWTIDPNNDNLFRGLELAEETGEVVGAMKKIHRAEKEIAGNTQSKEFYLENLKEEIGDVMICLDRVASLYNIDIEEVTRKKFNATSAKVNLDVFL